MPNKKTGRDEVVGFSSWSHYVADLEHPHKTIRQRWRNPSVFDCKSLFKLPRLHRGTSLRVGAVINSSLMNLESRYKSIITKLRPNQVPRLKSIAERSAALSKCRVKIPSPAERTPCYELNGMAVHVDWQGHGIASLLVQWGLDRATEENVPVFVAGEERGISFYQNALGFVRLPKSEYWLDRDAHEISREDVVDGNEDWKRQNDGVAGAYAVWCPDNVIVDADGCLITPYSSP